MRLLIATKNPAKFITYGAIAARAGFEIWSLNDFPDIAEPVIEEDRHSLEENARKKAAGYAQAYNEIVLSSDEGLRVEKYNPEWNEIIMLEPRRLGTGKRATDLELSAWHNEKLASVGGSSPAYHMLTIAIATPDGRSECAQFKLHLILHKRGDNFPPIREGYPLDSQSKSIVSGKFLSELPPGADWPVEAMADFV